MVDELESDTQYFFRLQYRDAAGNSELSDQMNFTTLETEEEDTTGPVISNVIGEAASTSITGSWNTNEPATSAIYTSVNAGFDLDDAGVIITEDNTLKTDHELTITGLNASTAYYHRIVVEDEAGNQTVSGQYLLGTD